MKVLTNDEAQRLYVRLNESIAPRDTFLQLLFETGCRVSESLPLGQDHLVGNKLTIPPLKNSKIRVVTLSDNLVRKLGVLPPRCWSDVLGEKSAPKSRRRALCRHWHQVSESLLGRRLNLHILRHTAFSRLYVATKDLMLVKQWAGHRSINSTLCYMQLDNQAEADRVAMSLLTAMGD